MNKILRSRFEEQIEYETKDGSMVRELMHPDVHKNLGVRKQSLAEACIEPGMATALHKHLITEELYHITAGEGLMRLGGNEFKVRAGDTVCIPPGMPHCIKATGAGLLRILCCSSPAYSHKDTELV